MKLVIFIGFMYTKLLFTLVLLTNTCDAEKKRTYSSESDTNKSLNKETKGRKTTRKTNSARKDGVSTNTVTNGKPCLSSTNSSTNSSTAIHSKQDYTSSDRGKNLQTCSNTDGSFISLLTSGCLCLQARKILVHIN